MIPLALTLALTACPSDDGQGDDESGEDTDTGPINLNCGNDVIEDAEECEGDNFQGETCESLGWAGGTLTCSDNCLIVPFSCESAGAGTACTDSNSDCPVDAPFCVDMVCTVGGEDDPCENNNDCNPLAPFCAAGSCHDGDLGDPCDFESDCAPSSPYCGGGQCTEGLEGDACEFDSDCSSSAPFCPDPSLTCSDGSEGDPCEFQNECQDGLACVDEVCAPE